MQKVGSLLVCLFVCLFVYFWFSVVFFSKQVFFEEKKMSPVTVIDYGIVRRVGRSWPFKLLKQETDLDQLHL
jgi:hypothetical protein